MHRAIIWMVMFGLMVTTFATGAAQGPEVRVTSPQNGATIMGTSVTVEIESEGVTLTPSTVPFEERNQHPEANRPDEGHLHLTLDAFPVVIVDSASPYTFVNVPTGPHQLTVELTNNDHSSFSPPVVLQIQFQSVDGAIVPNTGSPREDDPTNEYLLLGMLLAGVTIGLGLTLRQIASTPR